MNTIIPLINQTTLQMKHHNSLQINQELKYTLNHLNKQNHLQLQKEVTKKIDQTIFLLKMTR